MYRAIEGRIANTLPLLCSCLGRKFEMIGIYVFRPVRIKIINKLSLYRKDCSQHHGKHLLMVALLPFPILSPAQPGNHRASSWQANASINLSSGCPLDNISFRFKSASTKGSKSSKRRRDKTPFPRTTTGGQRQYGKIQR